GPGRTLVPRGIHRHNVGSAGLRGHRREAGSAILRMDDFRLLLWEEAISVRPGYVRLMERIKSVARDYGIEVLCVLLALEVVVVAAFRHQAPGDSRMTWFNVLAIPVVIAPMLGRRRFPFAAPAAVWLLATAASVVDGRLVANSVSGFVAGVIAAFLLGNLRDG